MLLKDLEQRRVAIWGLGSEGRAIREYLEKHRIPQEIIIYNDGDGAEAFNRMLNDAEVIIRSPGVSIYKDEFRQIKEQGIPVTSGSDLFLNEILENHPQTRVIGISGSKGKSTSVSMLFHMMRRLGCNVALGGNIGKPLVELLDSDYDFIIAEFSSYQASDLTASPQIVMFTNLFSVHTDWHRGHENYCRDKVHLAAHQKAGDVCIVNDENSQLKDYCRDLKNVIYYDIPSGFHAEGKILYYGKEQLLDINDLKISGNHNMNNLAGVMTIINYLGFDFRKAARSLQTFEPLPHRLQKVGTVDEILFINDSISTAPEAAIGGMQSFNEDMAIISGGIENQQDYQQYAKFIQHNHHVKVAVTLFQCGPQIAETIRRYVTREDFKLIEAENLADGVKAAFEELKKIGGKLVLFSPTAPSFGYYKNFMERGEDFIRIVKSLAK